MQMIQNENHATMVGLTLLQNSQWSLERMVVIDNYLFCENYTSSDQNELDPGKLWQLRSSCDENEDLSQMLVMV